MLLLAYSTGCLPLSWGFNLEATSWVTGMPEVGGVKALGLGRSLEY